MSCWRAYLATTSADAARLVWHQMTISVSRVKSVIVLWVGLALCGAALLISHEGVVGTVVAGTMGLLGVLSSVVGAVMSAYRPVVLIATKDGLKLRGQFVPWEQVTAIEVEPAAQRLRRLRYLKISTAKYID